LLEFCDKCGGILLPSKKKVKKVLRCNLCGNIKPIPKKLKNSYKINKEIYHPPGEEFINKEKMEEWEKKEIYNKFE
jgi:DNA-directed RNA polymerase subunit M/transcription elongation factor TFIIS